ncbi:MAG TPA: FG-GAP-like repeat-containing protein, partial [Solirubrobacteraceae bacterium]
MLGRSLAPALAGMLWLVLAGNAQATVRFDQQTLRLDYSPYPVVLADLDRDGATDALSGNKLALRMGDGSFDRVTDWRADYVDGTGVAYDGDEDGLIDVFSATTNSTAGNCDVTRFKGNGYGGFDSAGAYAGGGTGYSCAGTLIKTDYDGDGKPAWAIILRAGSDGHYLWFGPDIGGRALNGTATPTRSTTADRNGDGRMDLLALTSDGLVHQALAGSTTETTYAAASGAADLAAGDLTGDGKAEVVTVGRASVRTRNGAGGTIDWSIPGGGGSAVALGDVDGDGRLDMIVGVSAGSVHPADAVLVRLNQGAGVFSAPVRVGAAEPPFQLAVVPGPTGRTDVIAASNGVAAALLVNLSTAAGGFTAATTAFGTVAPGQAGAPRLVTFKNTGQDVLRVDHAHLSGLDADSFRLVSDGCQGAVLKSQQTCPLSVRFAPVSAGAKTAAVRVLHDAEG